MTSSSNQLNPIAALIRAIAVFILTACVAAIAFHMTTSSASHLPDPSSAPGLNQRTLTADIKARVEDNFSGSNGDPIAGTPSQLRGRSSNNNLTAGPEWQGTLSGGPNASQWTFIGNRAERNSGNSNYSTLLVPYLLRETIATVEVRQLASAGTDTQTGLLVGSNVNGTSGISASLWYNAGWEFSLWRHDGANSSSLCSSQATVTGPASNTTTYTIELTYDPTNPGHGAAASLSRSGGGNWNLSSTCSLATATGQYVGLASYESSAARYDNFAADF